MKIAFLGSRGVPARYSGFETFYEQLGSRLAERGHDVTIYNRSHFIRDVKGSYRGIRIVSLPTIPTKHLDTIVHTFLSSLHSLFCGYDIAYYCIVGNSPLAWIPRLSGARTLLNVDGEDWARQKWSGFAKWYQKRCEWVATKSANVIVADAHVINDRYSQDFGVRPVFVPYGANITQTESTDELAKWGLEPRRYILFVGRLVPENAADILIRAHCMAKTGMKLVIVGDAPYMSKYKQSLQDMANENTVFTGYAFGRAYQELSSHAYLYVQPSTIEGTRPALLDQLGFGNCALVCGNGANCEVVADCGCVFSATDPVKELAEQLSTLVSAPDRVQAYRDLARQRIESYYNWTWITDFHEDLFTRLIESREPVSYDRFLADRTG